MLISLVREHTEQMNPPRALWVPFVLGRPVGAPDEPAFQRRVLEAAFGLFARDAGPVLEDFPDDAPGDVPGDMSGWVCPVNLAPPPPDAAPGSLRESLQKEMASLQPWHDLHVEKKGRSVVGVGGLDIAQSVALIADFLDDQTVASPSEDKPLPLMLKFSAEDLKAWYLEAAAAQPGGSARALADWFWRETAGGKALVALAKTMRASENQGLQNLGSRGIVPRSHADLLS